MDLERSDVLAPLALGAPVVSTSSVPPLPAQEALGCIHTAKLLLCCKLPHAGTCRHCPACRHVPGASAGREQFQAGTEISVCAGEEAGLLRLAIARARRAGVAKEEVSKAPCAVASVDAPFCGTYPCCCPEAEAVLQEEREAT